jgi:phospholipid transport system substrate-binding protein
MGGVKYRYLMASLMAMALVPAASHSAYADDAAMAAVAEHHQVREAFAKDFAQKVLAVLQDPKNPYDHNKELVRQAFADSVDIDWIARFVLGKNWNAATPEQKQRYTSLYRKYLTESYVSHFADDPNKRIRDIKIFSLNDDKADDSDFTVRTQIMLANFDNLRVNYRVRENNGHYRVLDIIIENVSLITTHRNEFTALAQSSGVEGVIAKLEDLLNTKAPLLASVK